MAINIQETMKRLALDDWATEALACDSLDVKGLILTAAKGLRVGERGECITGDTLVSVRRNKDGYEVFECKIRSHALIY
jgi:hypothetical protein